MVTLGVDAHKTTHTVVAVDDNGRQIGTSTVKATSAGHLVAFRWASRFRDRCWALEDCRHVTRRLERELLGSMTSTAAGSLVRSRSRCGVSQRCTRGQGVVAPARDRPDGRSCAVGSRGRAV